MNNEDLYEKAQQKVKVKKSFYYHLISYVGVLSLLYAIMYFENQGQFLPVIIVGLSWGIGLAAHYFSAFGGFNPDWEEEALENELDRLTRKRQLKEEIQKEKALLDEMDILELRELEKKNMDRDY